MGFYFSSRQSVPFCLRDFLFRLQLETSIYSYKWVSLGCIRETIPDCYAKLNSYICSDTNQRFWFGFVSVGISQASVQCCEKGPHLGAGWFGLFEHSPATLVSLSYIIILSHFL